MNDLSIVSNGISLTRTFNAADVRRQAGVVPFDGRHLDVNILYVVTISRPLVVNFPTCHGSGMRPASLASA